jgi:hypothetical protein
LAAHHSAIASYEAARTMEIEGTVRQFQWRNPHCSLQINVTQGSFKSQVYVVELSSPSVMVESGWTRDLVRPGDHVVMRVHPSRVGAPVGLCRNCEVTINGRVTKPQVLQ